TISRRMSRTSAAASASSEASPSTMSRRKSWPCRPPPFENSISKSKQARCSVGIVVSVGGGRTLCAALAHAQVAGLLAVAAAARGRTPAPLAGPGGVLEQHRAARTAADARAALRPEQRDGVGGQGRERSLERPAGVPPYRLALQPWPQRRMRR